MECKVKLQQASSKQKAVLIETYWNVKPCGELLCIHPRGVLIETYWNVKTEEVTETPEPEAVLIETYWNVKNHSDVDFRLYPDKY